MNEEKLREALERRFVGGSRVTNCVPHMAKGWEERPADCERCRLDITNHISYCHRVNEHLNTVIDDARDAIE